WAPSENNLVYSSSGTGGPECLAQNVAAASAGVNGFVIAVPPDSQASRPIAVDTHRPTRPSPKQTVRPPLWLQSPRVLTPRVLIPRVLILTLPAGGPSTGGSASPRSKSRLARRT